jgi:multiple sugar transport system permease protein
VPYMVGGVMIGFQYRWFFNDQFGMLNNLLISLGIIQRPVAWLVTYPMESVIAASILHTAPFVTTLLLAGLASLPTELYQAAEVDGASRWAQFRHITLPLLAPLMMLILAIRYLAVPPVFEHIYLMTQGGPAFKTDVLMTYLVRNAYEGGQFGYGSAVAWLITLLQMTLLAFQLRLIRRLRI